MNNRQTRDWAKMHHDKQVRSTAKQEHETALIKHQNELLARFYGNPIFDSSVANKVNAELSAQLINEPIRHIV
jgi:hypothetical protein